jgi:hypothetical protein
MRKLLVITALLLFAGIAFGQTLKKGNLLGVHVMSVELKPGATMDQYIDFCKAKYIPASEKAYKGMKLFIMKGVRGVHNNSIGFIVQFPDEASRDQYYNDDGTTNELGNKLVEEMAPIVTEMEKIGTWSSEYTDWVLL